MTREDRSRLFEVAILSALGGALGTTLAIAFAGPWWQGALSGAFIASLMYHPVEAAQALRRTAGHIAQYTVEAVPGIDLWKKVVTVATAIPRVTLTTLYYFSAVALWCFVAKICFDVSAAFGVTSLEPWWHMPFSGLLAFVCGGLALVFASTVRIEFYDRHAKGPLGEKIPFWCLPLTRAVGWIIFRLEHSMETAPQPDAGTTESVNIAHGSLRHADGSLLKKEAFADMGAIIVFATVMPPVAIVTAALCAAVIAIDLPLTILLSLGTTRRIAVLGGGFLGASVGYTSYIVSASSHAPTAVILGALVGFVAGPLLNIAKEQVESALRTATTTALQVQ